MKPMISILNFALAGLIALRGLETTYGQQHQDGQPAREEHQGRSPKVGVPNVKQDSTPLPQDIKARTSFAPIAKRIAPSVVNVYSTRTVREHTQFPFSNDPLFRRFFGGENDGSSAKPHSQQGLGSSVIVSEDGYIITNNHVVEDSSDVRVALVGGEEYPAKVVGNDPATDIAVLKVERTGLPAITLADSALLEVGDTVLAVGNPFGVGQTVTAAAHA